MRIFRIAKTQYINDFSGEGSRLYGGRWNKIGDPVIYFSDHLSLCLLEVIVHVDYGKIPMDYSFAEVEIPDTCVKTIRSLDFIAPKWTAEDATNKLQFFGSKWLKEQESLALRVPSAVLQKENNIMVNPLHIDFKKLKIIEIGQMDFDPRLWR